MKEFLKRHFKLFSFMATLIDHFISLLGFLIICESTKQAIGYWLILVGAIYLLFNNLHKISGIWGTKLNNWIFTQLEGIEKELEKQREGSDDS